MSAVRQLRTIAVLGAASMVLLACAGSAPAPARPTAPHDVASAASAQPRGEPPSANVASAADSAPARESALPALADAYRGTIGADARIVVRLQTTQSRIAGRYFYETVGDALALEGTSDDHGRLELVERNRTGQVTGTFRAQRQSGGAIAGTWLAPGGRRRLPLTLTPIVRASGPGPVLVFKRAYRNRDRATDEDPPIGQGRPDRCDIKVEYPEVFGLASADAEAKINAALAYEEERVCIQPCEGERGYEITFNRDGILGVDVGGNHMCWWAAHPSNFEGFSATFLTRTGERLALDQVFKAPFAAHAKALFGRVIDAQVRGAEPDQGYDEREILTDAYDDPEFVVIEGGVRFFVARHLPHAFQGLAADPTELTFAQMKEALDPRSPIAFLWRE